MYGCLPSFPLFLTLIPSLIKFSSHPRVGNASPTSPISPSFFSFPGFERFSFCSPLPPLPLPSSLSLVARPRLIIKFETRPVFRDRRDSPRGFCVSFFHAWRDAVLITRDLWRVRAGLVGEKRWVEFVAKSETK